MIARPKLYAVLLSALLLLSCSKSTSISPEEGQEKISSVLYLKSLCAAAHYPITEDIIIRGVVTGNNRYGEFNRSLVLQDETGGITLYADYSPKHPVYYKVGNVITVLCNGLTLIDYGGKVVLGKAGGGDDFAIPRSELDNHIKINSFHPESRKPQHRRIAELSPRDVDTYIALDDVHFTTPSTWCDTDPTTGRPVTTEHVLKERGGDSIIVRTLWSCHYAKEPLPEGNGSLYGILDFFNGKYSIHISAFETVLVTPPAAHSTTYP